MRKGNGMKFLDLFAGIGGFRLGMEMAGHECVGHCEIDKFANASYIAMHKPKEDEWFADDITRVRAVDIPGADCWCFGFPCQDISVAGKQGGFTSGKRSSLFFTVTGLIRELEEENRPAILFIENVKNLLSINGGFDFAKLLIELDEIGYDAEWQVLNSKNFGVPQNRERVFIIGHLRGRGRRKVFPVSDDGKGNTSAVRRNLRGMRKDCFGCILTRPNKGDRANLDTLIYDYKNNTVRQPTPRECFLAQGFPEEYFNRVKDIQPEKELYKQAGNSVTVNVIYEIAKRLEVQNEPINKEI